LPDGAWISVDVEVGEAALCDDEGLAMLECEPSVHIYLACRPMGMRMGFDGLVADAAKVCRPTLLFARSSSFVASAATI